MHAYDETPVDLVVYVRNDPVNLVDPDGRDWVTITGTYWIEWWTGDPRQYEPEIIEEGTFEINIWTPTPRPPGNGDPMDVELNGAGLSQKQIRDNFLNQHKSNIAQPIGDEKSP